MYIIKIWSLAMLTQEYAPSLRKNTCTWKHEAQSGTST